MICSENRRRLKQIHRRHIKNPKETNKKQQQEQIPPHIKPIKQSKKFSWTTLRKVAPEQTSVSVNLVLSLLKKYQFN